MPFSVSMTCKTSPLSTRSLLRSSLGNRTPAELPTDVILSEVITYLPGLTKRYNKCYNVFDYKNKLPNTGSYRSRYTIDILSYIRRTIVTFWRKGLRSGRCHLHPSKFQSELQLIPLETRQGFRDGALRQVARRPTAPPSWFGRSHLS